jgi:hypothetical protein
MTNINDIYVDGRTKLSVDPDNCILYICTATDGYDKKMFHKFLEYLTTFWSVVENSNDKYHILLDLSEATAEMMPMDFYTTLIKTINGMGKSIETNLHSMCVLMNSGGLINGIIKMALKFFDVPRPMKVVEKREDVQPFFDANKLDL